MTPPPDPGPRAAGPPLVAGIGARRAEGDDLRALLTEAFVGGGFTAPDRAATAFAPEAVRARGEILVAWLPGRERPAGMVVLARHGPHATRLAGPGEGELLLLAAAAAARGRGVGRALVLAALDRARRAGLGGVLLWTQPGMTAAQRIYERTGFVRRPGRDFAEDGRSFMVYEAVLPATR